MLSKTIDHYHFAKINKYRGRKPQKPCGENLCFRSYPGMRQDHTLEHVPFRTHFSCAKGPVWPRISLTKTKTAFREVRANLSPEISSFSFLKETFFCIRARWSRHGVINVTECQTRIQPVIALTLSISNGLFYNIVEQYLTGRFVSYKTVLKAL